MQTITFQNPTSGKDGNIKSHSLYHRDKRADKYHKGPDGRNYVIGITDQYVVQFIRSTCVVRVLDAGDPEYHNLMSTVENWTPIDPHTLEFESEYGMMNKVLRNLLKSYVNRWLHIDYYCPYD